MRAQQFSRRRLLLGAAGAAAGASINTHAATADAWPNRPVRFVVPLAAGGGGDSAARILANEMTKRLGQSFLVENRSGGNMFIAASEVAKSSADGHTLLFALDAMFTINPFVFDKLPYDPEKTFAPVSLVSTQEQWWVARPELGIKTMAELIAKLKAKPGSINYGYSAPSGQLAAELLKSLTGAQMNLVPYRGGGPLALAVLAGEVDMAGLDLSPLVQHIQSGKMVPLGQTGVSRSALFPDVKTMVEQGLVGFEAIPYWALFTPAGTSAATVDRIGAEVARALAAPDVREQISKLGYTAAASTPEQLAARTRHDADKWSRLIRANNLKLS